MLVYSSGLFGSKNWNFPRQKNDFNDFNDLRLPYFSSCKNKRIKQKTNPTASKMKLFMTLVDGLFGKQLNNITKNCRCCRGPRSTSLFSILKKRVWFIHPFRTYCSRVYDRLRAHARKSIWGRSAPLNRVRHFTGEYGNTNCYFKIILMPWKDPFGGAP